MNKKFKIVIVILIVLIILSGSLILFTNNKKPLKLDENRPNWESENQTKNESNNDLIIDDKNNSEGNKDEVDQDKNDKVENIEKDNSSANKNEENTGTSNSDKDNKVNNKEDNNKPVENNNQQESNNQNDQNNEVPPKKEENDKADDKEEDTKVEDDKKEEEQAPEQPKDENDIYRKKIESTYGITIKYGEEMGDYKPHNLTPTKLLESDKIKANLTSVETELKKYPTGFFKDFKGMPLTIYLVKSVPNNAFAGFTDKQFMNDIKITIVDDYYSFSYTLNHEIMHYIDAYLEIKMYPIDPFEEYKKLNPSGFEYGNINESYNYGYNAQIRGMYFLNNYSQTEVREDRAEIFKQMMTRVYKPVGMFDEGEVMRKKALIISGQIKTYFPSAKGTQYWDKIIG